MADEKALPPGEGDNEENLPAPAGQEPDETLEVQAPNVGEQSETTRLERRKKLSLKDEDDESPAETVETPAPGETQSTVLQDPTRRRDTNTASLKRLRPQDLNAPSDDSAEEDPDNTETVNIKVIKEQKKQFRNMMTSSQTLKVNPDGSPAEEEAPGETVKVQEADTRTESISRPQGGQQPQQPAGGGSPKSTLKIKAPPGVAPAQSGGAKPGATLKIKAPAPAGGGEAEGPDPSARTVKQSAPGRPGKTLKLRGGAPPPRQATSGKPAGQPTGQAPLPYDTGDVSPGAFIIVPAASLLVAGVFLWRVIASASELYNGFGGLFQ